MCTTQFLYNSQKSPWFSNCSTLIICLYWTHFKVLVLIFKAIGKWGIGYLRECLPPYKPPHYLGCFPLDHTNEVEVLSCGSQRPPCTLLRLGPPGGHFDRGALHYFLRQTDANNHLIYAQKVSWVWHLLLRSGSQAQVTGLSNSWLQNSGTLFLGKLGEVSLYVGMNSVMWHFA